MQIKSLSIWAQVLFCVLVSALFVIPVHGQSRSERVFEAVPQQLRNRLIERLNVYLEYQRTQQYRELYGLLYEFHVSDSQNISEAAYVEARQQARNRNGVLTEFSPEFIMNLTLNDNDPPTYSITGQGKMVRRTRSSRRQLAIHARFQDGDWYFSDYTYSFLGSGSITGESQ